MLKYLILLLLIAACGTSKKEKDDNNDRENEIKALQDQLLQLQGTQTQINNLINSDFSTCPNSGDTSDPLINKICKVAQASTVEARVEMKDELATFQDAMNDKLTAVNNDLVTLNSTEQSDVSSINTQIATINTSLASLTSQLTTLQTQMTSANAAISALQTLTNSINGVLNGTVSDVTIGTENLASGPIYESVLRRTDKSRITAYVQAYGTTLSFGNNPWNATSGSPTLTFTLSAHGYSVGDVIYMTGLAGSRGFTSADLTGEFTIVTVPDVNTFTLTMSKNATSSGTGGGAAGLVYKVIGRGMALVWQTSNGADSAVRQTTLGTKRYNFIVKATGDICYDKTNNAATFATITANGSNIVCK